MTTIPISSAPTGRTLAPGTYRAAGPATFALLKGSFEAAGASFSARGPYRVPVTRSLTFRVSAPAEIQWLDGDEAGLAASADDGLPADWRAAADALAAAAAPVILLAGEMDTGKSTFAAYLANRFLSSEKPVAVLDADGGQSDVGPPGTIGLALLTDPVPSLAQAMPTALAHVGSHTPALHLAPALTGLHKLLKKAREERGAKRVVINTPGWTQGDGGRLLHRALFDLLAPDRVVFLERDRECEALVKGLPPEKVLRVKAPSAAAARPPEDRRRYREESAGLYYRQRRFLMLPFHHVRTDRAYFLTGAPQPNPPVDKVLYAEKFFSEKEGAQAFVKEPLTPEEETRVKEALGVPLLRVVKAGTEAGAQVALCDEEGEVLALGIVQKFDLDRRYIEVWTPLALGKEGRVKVVQFGSLRLTLDGREAGFLEPGAL